MNVDILILSWHQTYLSSYAGGYIRLKEFLKRIPKKNSFLLLDNLPSIFKEDVPENCLIEYSTPKFLLELRENFFIFWAMLETIISGAVVYKESSRLVSKHNIKLLYVPVGEFPQLYLPAVLLRKRFPNVRLVVDILNYELPENFTSYFRRLRGNGVGFFRASVIIVMFYFGLFSTNFTLGLIDYIFTVSPELVEKIKKNYKKSTIDYTPSGVNLMPSVRFSPDKKYAGVYVGRMTIQKGIMDVLAVWSGVIKKKTKARLALVGAVDSVLEKEIKKQIKHLGLTKHVDFYGRVSEKEKFRILSDSQLFLHLARYEPLFPVIGILEGYAAGCPSVIYQSDLVSQKKLTKDKDFIFQAENGNISEATKFVVDYLELLPADKKRLFGNAISYAKEFDWGKISQREFKIWSRLMKG